MGEYHQQPRAATVVHVCKQIMDRIMGISVHDLQWHSSLVFDCRAFYEHMEALRKQPDWGHCGLHPANVVWHLQMVVVLRWIGIV